MIVEVIGPHWGECRFSFAIQVIGAWVHDKLVLGCMCSLEIENNGYLPFTITIVIAIVVDTAATTMIILNTIVFSTIATAILVQACRQMLGKLFSGAPPPNFFIKPF